MNSKPRLWLGARVRLKARTMSGWKGTGTYLRDGRSIKDGRSDPDGFFDAEEHELAVCRDQTPNPEHAKMVLGRRLLRLISSVYSCPAAEREK